MSDSVPAPAPTRPDQTFRAQIDGRTLDVHLRDGQVWLDDKVVDCGFAQVSEGYFSLLLDGQSFPVVVERGAGGRHRVTVGERQVEVRVKDEKALLLERFGLEDADAEAELEVRAPMPGLVLKVLVEPGMAVSPGDALVVLEAMKMENELRATGEAVVKSVHAVAGDAVGKNDLLIAFES